MLFATVGTQLPFDRLVLALDKWHLNQRVNTSFAQIGKLGKQPKHMSFAKTLTPLQFAKNIASCKVIVSHAGMGTILTALQIQKPIVIMPRLAEYGEHRNDHQLATAENLKDRNGIYVARSEEELFATLDDLNSLDAAPDVSAQASQQLLTAVRGFISDQEVHHA